MNEQSTLKSASSVKLSDIYDRIFACLIDGVILGLPTVVMRYGTVWAAPATTWIGVLFSMGYYITCHGPFGGGQTLGKRMLGLRVVSMDGDQPTWGQSAIRFLVFSPPTVLVICWLVGLPDVQIVAMVCKDRPGLLLVMLFHAFIVFYDTAYYFVNRKGRALHDVWAGTIVLKTGGRVDNAANQQCIDEKSITIKSGRWLVIGIMSVFVGGLWGIDWYFVKRYPDLVTENIFRELLQSQSVQGVSTQVQSNSINVLAKFPYSPYIRKTENEDIPLRLTHVVKSLIYLKRIDPQTIPSVQFQVSSREGVEPSWTKKWIVQTNDLHVDSNEVSMSQAKPMSEPLLDRQRLDAELVPFLDKKWDAQTQALRAQNGKMTPIEAQEMAAKLHEAVVEKARKEHREIVLTEEVYNDFARNPDLFDIALKQKKAIHKMTEYLRLIRTLGAKTTAAQRILDSQIAYFVAAEERVERHIAALSQK